MVLPLPDGIILGVSNFLPSRGGGEGQLGGRGGGAGRKKRRSWEEEEEVGLGGSRRSWKERGRRGERSKGGIE